MQKIIKDSEMVPVQMNNLVLDSTVTPGSFNAPTSDAVAQAIAEGGSSYSAGDGIAIANDVISARVDGSTVEINDGKLAVKSRPRYTTRSDTATSLPASINVNDGESFLWNINRVGSGAITIAAPAGTTDAQVAIISTGSSFYINTSNLSVTVGGVSIPVFDLRLPAYGLNTGVEYGILKSNYALECSIEVPPSFDEVGLVDQVLTDANINKTAKTTNKMVVQIVGQVALLFAE